MFEHVFVLIPILAFCAVALMAGGALGLVVFAPRRAILPRKSNRKN
jgi:hypothetical protein